MQKSRAQMQLFENTHKQATSNSERAVAMIVRFRRYLFIHICMHSEASGEHWAVRWECHELLLLFGTYFSNLKIRLHTEFIYIFYFLACSRGVDDDDGLERVGGYSQKSNE